jgi:L-cysteine S-thiosulfotransferase
MLLWLARSAAVLMAATFPASAQTGSLVPYTVEGDAIPRPLANASGDPNRGQALVLDHERGNCTICHVVPGPDARYHGNLGPSLTGVGRRLSAGQIRLRIVDSTRLNPVTIMPAYYRIENLHRVAAPFRERPVLSPQDVEDVVAYLSTLRN